jgi:signal transduction histidine kinase/DNA-binding LacI/PurR family transcriptional regulator/AraC-like DNA-binding protein
LSLGVGMSKAYKHSRPTIGVLAGWQVYHGFVHSFLDSLFRGIRLAAEARDCNLLLACGVTPGLHIIRPAWPVLAADTDFVPVGPWNTDGLIVATPLLSAARSAYIQQLIAEGHPVVFVGLGERGPAVVTDNAGGIRQALAHLVEHGHRQIAFVAGIEGDIGDSQARLDAYQAAVREYGLEDDPRLIVYSHHTALGGREGMSRLLESGVSFTAVLGSNDDAAMGAMTILRQAGRRIPEEVAVMGFDDSLEATSEMPSLSTVHYPARQAGAEALELLLRYIRGEISQPEIISIPTRLVIRQSCGCRPGRLNVGLAHSQTAPASAELRSESERLGVTASAQMLPIIEARLVQAMTEAAGTEVRLLSPSEVTALCQSLVKAFRLSLEQADATTFQLAVEELLRRVERVDDDAHAWQAVISALESGAGALQETVSAPAPSPGLAEEMLRQARINISESVRRQSRRHVVGQRWFSDQGVLLAGRLLVAMNEAEIFKALEEHLPGVGIQQAHVLFFEPEKDDPVAWSELRTHSSEAPRRFHSRDFPPPDLYALDRPFHLALLPLIIQDEVSGFVAFASGDLALCATVVWQLTAALRSAQLYRLKNRFLSIVSHELRTPLNLIVGLSEVLLREQAHAGTAFSAQARDDVEHIHASAQHLSGLIRDVLDLAGSEAGRLKLAREPLNLREVLEVVAGTGQSLARDKGLNWRAEIPESLPWVWGDRTRLRQVALNLVSNAVKFTEHGTITLTVERMKDEVGRMKEEGGKWQVEGFSSSFIPHPSSFILVSVSDTGLGIPPAEQSVIFNEFRQSERTTARGYGGLGLGLAICKRLIELHGGEIGVYSSGKEGEGSTFYFSLPIWEGEKIAASLPASAAQSPTVLLLTEAPDGGGPLGEHLQRQGFEVAVRQLTGNGEWLPQVVELSPGAVILELGAASERGWDILRVLKEHPSTQDLPVLFYSLAQEQDSGAVLEMDYLMKPVEAADLTRALARQGLEAGAETEKKTILIADDEPGILDMHTRMVQTQAPDCRVIKAKNGREALSVLEREHVDLVLLDLMMPELDGFGVLETMQTQAGMREVPVIVLTSQVLSEDDMARLNRGVVTVLGKGVFNIEETLGHVAAALERNRKLGSETQRLVRKGMAYVHEHYPEAFTRETLARYVGVSEDYLTRCFRQELGLTPMAYLTRYRLSRAKELLVSGHKSVTEVAMAVGFLDTKYFSRVFRREVGVSPAAYRRGL